MTNKILKNLSHRFIGAPIIGSALFIMTQACSPTKNVTYSSDPDPEKKEFYKYDKNQNWTIGKKHLAIHYHHIEGNIRKNGVFIGEKIDQPTDRQAYLEKLIDISQESKIGKSMIRSAKKHDNFIFSDSISKNVWGGYQNEKIKNTLLGFDDEDISEKEKAINFAMHLMTMGEELYHAFQDQQHGVFYKTSEREQKLSPSDQVHKIYNAEAAAKVVSIMFMHELKYKGYEDTYEDAQFMEKNNIIGRMMEHYNNNIDEKSSIEDKLEIASTMHQKILKNPDMREAYFPNSFEKQFTENDIFTPISEQEIENSAYIPSFPHKKDNFIKSIENIFDGEFMELNPKQYQFIENAQDSIQKYKPNYERTQFIKTDLGAYKPIKN